MMGTCSVMMVQPKSQNDYSKTTLSSSYSQPPPPMISPRDVFLKQTQTNLTSSLSTSHLSKDSFRRNVKLSSGSSTSTELCDELIGQEIDDDDEYSDLEIETPITKRRFSKSYDHIHSVSQKSGEEEEDKEKCQTNRKSFKNKADDNDPQLKIFKVKQHSSEESTSSFEQLNLNTVEKLDNKVYKKLSDNDNELDDPDQDGKELEECIRKFQHQIMRTKIEQFIN